MIQSNDVLQRFERWLDRALPALTPCNSIDVHVDELGGRGLTSQERLDAVVELFASVVERRSEKLAGKVVMLMIPLQSSAAFDSTVPEWVSLATQLSSTPPSIYVMNVSAFLQADRAQRYICPANIPALDVPNFAQYYQCWRNEDDPLDEGWSRDVRVVSAAFVS